MSPNEQPPFIPASPRDRVDWGALSHDAWRAQWAMANGRGGLLCMPVIAAWVFAGVIGGHRRWAVLGVAGAVAVGFGAFQRLGNSRVLPMTITLAGIALATWAGSVAGNAGWVYLVILATCCGFGYGAMTMIGYGGWWIGLQWMIALLVYGAHPAAPAEAARDALLVVAGGGSQLMALTLLPGFTSRWFNRQKQPPLNTNEPLLRSLVKNSKPRTPAGRYAIRVALALGLSTIIAHFSHLPNGYWAPMTAVILLKPDFHEVTVRGINRMVGTLLGAGLTTILLALFRPEPMGLGLLLLAAIWGCLAMQRVNHAIMAACITAYVVLLFATLGLPELVVAEHRIIATLAGAAVAMGASLVLPLRAE